MNRAKTSSWHNIYTENIWDPRRNRLPIPPSHKTRALVPFSCHFATTERELRTRRKSKTLFASSRQYWIHVCAWMCVCMCVYACTGKKINFSLTGKYNRSLHLLPICAPAAKPRADVLGTQNHRAVHPRMAFVPKIRLTMCFACRYWRSIFYDDFTSPATPECRTILLRWFLRRRKEPLSEYSWDKTTQGDGHLSRRMVYYFIVFLMH